MTGTFEPSVVVSVTEHRAKRAAINDARAALEKIAACETEHANATVKRMAKIAREALCALSLVASN